MSSKRLSSRLLVLTGGVTWAVIAACGGGSDGSTFHGGAADGGDGGGPTPTFGNPDPADEGPFTDFAAEPIIDDRDAGGAAATPANAAALFAAGGAAGGDGSSPCLAEPEVDSLIPRNWLRPRFSWAGSGGANLFEIRVHADNQVNDLVVYTTASTWTMPKAMWTSFAGHSAGHAITMSIRGGKLADGAVTEITQGSQGNWSIAPVDAPGSIVYWYIIKSADTGELKGFSVGDEDTRLVLKPEQVQEKSGAKCIGCHTSSPDGDFALLSSREYGGDGLDFGTGAASIQASTVGQKPSFMTSQAVATMSAKLQGISTTTKAHWTTGRHLVMATREQDHSLAVVNLDSTDTDAKKLEISGLKTSAVPSSPSWSHDGTKVAFVAGAETDGRPDGSANDIYIVPYNDGAGGAATALNGASTNDGNEYYPAFSPDDKLIAFTKTKDEGSYAATHAEIFVVDAKGGTPVRLAANDPPTCTKKTSPGVENSWPKWAPSNPAGSTVDGKTYYWLVFSSTRGADSSKRQLYMAPVVVGADGSVAQYKAVYLWNQPAGESNHTPAWDVFAIPPSTVK